MKEKTPKNSQSTSELAKDISATTITEGTETTTSGTSTNIPNTPGWQTTDDQISVESATPSPQTFYTGRHTQNSYSSTDGATQTNHMTSGKASRVSISITETTVLVKNISLAHTRPAGIQVSAGHSYYILLGSGLLADQYFVFFLYCTVLYCATEWIGLFLNDTKRGRYIGLVCYNRSSLTVLAIVKHYHLFL